MRRASEHGGGAARGRPSARCGRARAAAALLLAGLAVGCRARTAAPDLTLLYQGAAQGWHDVRNPVVVIPGILGSRLVEEETGTVVWGAFGGDFANPARAEGARLFALPLGAAEGEDDDGVVPDGALDRLRVTFLGVPLSLRAYANILAALGVGGYRDEGLALAGAIDYGEDHFTCFQFDYDWRRDLVQNAERFEAFLAEKRAYVEGELRERYGEEAPAVRFDVVAHSMGGLLTRYYLRHGTARLPEDGALPEPSWAGAPLIERAILVGTPNAGSVEAWRQLVDGVRHHWLLPKYQAALLGTLPSVYQLLPRARHGAAVWADTGERIADLHDPALWREMGWGLADPRQARVLEQLLPEVEDPAERRRIALAYQERCLASARRFAEALDAPAEPPPGTELFLVAGDAIPTPARAAVDRETGRVAVDAWGPGDRTVLRSSALHDERVGGEAAPTLVSPIAWAGVLFLFEDHLGLTKSAAFTDNLLYLLLEDPRRRVRREGGP